MGSTTMHQAVPYLRENLPVPVINPGPLTYKLAECCIGLGLSQSRRRTRGRTSRSSRCSRRCSWALPSVKRTQPGAHDAAARRRPHPRRRAVRGRAVGDAAAGRSRRRGRSRSRTRPRRATSAATCRRSRRARTRSSSRPSTAARRASRSTCATRARARCCTTSCGCATASTRTSAATSRASSGSRYDQLRDVNPRIVCCSLSGFGMTGPRAAEGGYDYMMQGLAGWQTLTGEPGGPPTKSGLSLVDLSGGYASAIALLAGIWRARRDGVGCDCDVSLFETALHELMYIGPWAATHGFVPPRTPEVGAPHHRPLPELRGLGRLVRRRGARSRCSGSDSAR